jgi:putative acetyltransferase
MRDRRRGGELVIEFRAEGPSDARGIHDLNVLAFGQPTEAEIVDALRISCADFLSLVARDEGAVVGHILFTPATIEREGHRIVGMGLAPLAVVPERRGQGIGSELVLRGLNILRERKVPFVVVLGHPGFYPRFGFERASAHGLSCQWEGVPDEAFMVLVLDPPAMEGVSGMACYRSEFDAAV